jgi:uncharacterized membrane protein YdjX (TVP38/TMEM64 family)
MWRRLLWPLAALLVLSAAVVAAHALGRSRLFTRENIETLEAFITGCGMWGPLVYIVLCVVAITLMSPALPWIIVAAMFGVMRGIVLASLGLTLGAAACFLMARYAIRPVLQRWAGHTREFRKIEDGVREHGWRMVMITRLVPIFPFNIQNFAYGLTALSFWTYLFVTWICTLPAVIAYVLAAGALVEGHGNPQRALVYLGAAAMLLVALSFLPRLLKKKTPWLKNGSAPNEN